MPKVSIVMPTYNVEKYFRQCIESVINQTLADCHRANVCPEQPNLLYSYLCYLSLSVTIVVTASMIQIIINL